MKVKQIDKIEVWSDEAVEVKIWAPQTLVLWIIVFKIFKACSSNELTYKIKETQSKLENICPKGECHKNIKDIHIFFSFVGNLKN